MAKIWAERIIAGTRQFEKVPAYLKAEVENILKLKFANGELEEENLKKILGGELSATVH